MPSATSIQQQLCNDTASDIGPFCQEVVPTNNPINSPIYDAHPKTKADEVREESVKKRRMLQDRQGEKMKKRHEESLKQLGKEVKRGSMITLHVDPRVASHARGVTAVVVDCLPDTGGVIACSSKGIVVNGKGKKEWWIAADMYRLNSGPGELFTAITPELAAIQKLIIEGQFDASSHPRCTLGDAHADMVGASSPCKRNSCGCKSGMCSGRCGCVRNKISCSSSCSCSGNCVINPKNHNKG